MKSTLLNAALKVIPNQQILVNMVSQRVRQLTGGARPLIATLPGTGAADIALTEIMEGKLTFEKVVAVEDEVEPKLVKFPAKAPGRLKPAA